MIAAKRVASLGLAYSYTYSAFVERIPSIQPLLAQPCQAGGRESTLDNQNIKVWDFLESLSGFG